MGLKTLKPFTPAARGTVLVDYSSVWKGKPEKSLTKGKSSTGGRNNLGRMTCRHRGGGVKRAYRMVDFSRSTSKQVIVQRVEYDPNRTAFIALVRSKEDGTKSYIVAPNGIKRGDIIGITDDSSQGKVGWKMKLADIPTGVIVHNVELKPGAGGVLARSGGVGARVVAKDGEYVTASLPSGERRLILASCSATIGSVSNPDNKNIKLGKAGRSRWKGRRPSVRGVAMNPVDHPLGGGEGKSSGGRHPVTPWGVSTKGKKTRKPGKASDRFIRSRRK